ncbi:MAG: DNA helicase, partial [Prevotella bivia]|nr:DNA helicase [Prevotella bivia]
LFDCSVNRFFVKGQESIYYTYNNGKLAADPKLACENFVNALERIPKVIESHEKEMAKVVSNKDVYTNIANGSWKKEDELRVLKGEAAELDRKIALTLALPEEEKEDEQQVGIEEDLQPPITAYKKQTELSSSTTSISTIPDNPLSAQYENRQNFIDKKDMMSNTIVTKPKWRM